MDIKAHEMIIRCFLLPVLTTGIIQAAPDDSLLTSQTFSGLKDLSLIALHL